MISKERRNFIAFLHERHVYDVSRKRTRVKRVVQSRRARGRRRRRKRRWNKAWNSVHLVGEKTIKDLPSCRIARCSVYRTGSATGFFFHSTFPPFILPSSRSSSFHSAPFHHWFTTSTSNFLEKFQNHDTHRLDSACYSTRWSIPIGSRSCILKTTITREEKKRKRKERMVITFIMIYRLLLSSYHLCWTFSAMKLY